MTLDIKRTLKSQYLASLEMMKRAVEACPDSQWEGSDHQNAFWNIAYHALVYTHFYLHASEDAFVPWEKYEDRFRLLGQTDEDLEAYEPYSKAEILEFLQFVGEQVDGLVESLELDSESGFSWLPFDKMELQIYNIRHLQQHTGELCERLGRDGTIEIGWVGTKPH